MKIHKVIETNQGRAEFSGELSSDEYNFIVEVGLATLLAQGALPFINSDQVEAGKVSGEVGNA
jgi:hypothetical protein